ncbi:DUF5959 family protein [Myceligenerans indicum]|uniref:Uncharacterized protein n=1 Tax=Myceligenerans indicum TaxID=2593663 RepID=A0ABS1LPB1_9MICO|nr:DUF5959 family protein [Myceligenerans indicum]MBL0888091.1 hypothetical protein [Myceligenerans indicum]
MTLSLPYTLAVFRGDSIRVALEVTELEWISSDQAVHVRADIAIEGEGLTCGTLTELLDAEELRTFQGFLDELDRGRSATWEPSPKSAELDVELREHTVFDTVGVEPWVTVKPYGVGLVVGGVVSFDDDWFEEAYARFDTLQDHLEQLRSSSVSDDRR